jgi:hypothetical protein
MATNHIFERWCASYKMYDATFVTPAGSREVPGMVRYARGKQHFWHDMVATEYVGREHVFGRACSPKGGDLAV